MGLPFHLHLRTGGGYLAAAASICVLTGTAGGATRHVPGEYPTIQAGVNAASAGDTILVAPGIYAENVVLDRQVALLSEAGPEVTTIDGQGRGPVVQVGLSLDHVCIEGFRITGGYDQGYFWAAGINVQWGLYTTIRRNIVEHNRAYYGAGGIFSGGYAIVEDNIVQYNNPTPSDSYASAMIVSGTVERNVIRHNGWSDGYIVWVQNTNTFAWNTVVENGAAWTTVWVRHGGSIHHNTIARNGGGEIAVNLDGNGPVEFHNNLVAHGDEDGLYCSVTGPSLVQCNDVWGPGSNYTGGCSGMEGVDGNISVDPLFCNAAQGDYRLNAASPCAPLNSPAGCELIGALDVACGITAIGDPATSPRIRLQVVPNPIRSSAAFTLDPTVDGWTLDIYDAQGRLLDVLRSGGAQLPWTPPESATSGVYFGRLRGSGNSEVVKFLILR